MFRAGAPFLDLVFSLSLDHLAPIANLVETSRHLLSSLLLELDEALEVEEADVFDGALDGQIDHCGRLGQNR